MRTDLTANFITAKNAATRSPRQLAVFHFNLAGDVYISDQALGAADGLSNEYAALVEDWDELVDIAGGDPTDKDASEVRQLSITIWNGGSAPFSDYFLRENPENVMVDVYQWFAGLSESDKALIDTLVIQDPIEYDEASFLLRLDLVSLSMRYDRPIGDLLERADWPNAKATDIGKGIDLPIGSPGELPTLIAKTAPVATLNGSILAITTTVSVNENLTTLGFSASGTIQIGEEKMTFSSRTSGAFTISQRGAGGTEAEEHLNRDNISQVITDYTFLVGRGPISAISSVKVAGFPAPAIYTTYPALNPARIVFSEKPYAVQYAKGSRFLEMHADMVNADNTAWQAHHAYDAAARASAAKINNSYPKLSIRQVTVNPDRGEIVKAYLAVEHWESSVFESDYAEVAISGIGVLGSLSRPNVADTIDVEGETDIDHGHTHVVGDEHTHTFTDPSLRTDDPSHAHALTGVSDTTRYYSGQVMNIIIYRGVPVLITFPGIPLLWQSANLFVSCGIDAGVTLTAYYRYPGGWRALILKSGSYTIGLGAMPPGISFFAIRFEASGESGNADLFRCYIDVTTGSDVENEYTAVTTGISVSGSSADASDKKEEDVDNLATANTDLQVTDKQSATRSIINLFDITGYVNFDWAWFTNQDITVEYKGTSDSKDIYLLHVFFDVEYRKKEVVFSNEVTCEVTGLIDDGSGTYTGTPNAVITRPDHVRKYILSARGGLPVAYIDPTSFANAGIRYAGLAYYFDGLLDADLTVREAEKKLARQSRSRFFWNAGRAKIAVQEKLADWSIVRDLGASDLRLRALSVTRKRVANLVNTIRLFYSRDWTSKEGGSKDYKASVNDNDTDSVTQHGVREKRDDYLFDCVSRDAMAADLLDFYVEEGAQAGAFYTAEAYLGQFELEKNDIITITAAGLHKIKKARMVVRALDRVFGSGKTGRMNMIRIVAECLHYILLEQSLSDTIKALDALSIELGVVVDLSELAVALEELRFSLNVGRTETVTAADVLNIIADWKPRIDELATASDLLYAALVIAISDTVTIEDWEEIYQMHGFGGGGFGESGFGGYVRWQNRSPDELQASDELSLALSVALGYSADKAAADEYGFGKGGFGQTDFGGWTDSVEVSDRLYFSDGFGRYGFGETPFGG